MYKNNPTDFTDLIMKELEVYCVISVTVCLSYIMRMSTTDFAQHWCKPQVEQAINEGHASYLTLFFCISWPLRLMYLTDTRLATSFPAQPGSQHTCRCGSLVEATGVHGLVCRQAPSRVVRHHALNECISCACSASGIQARKDPAGLVQRDGKRPDSCTVIPWRGGMSQCVPQWLIPT